MQTFNEYLQRHDPKLYESLLEEGWRDWAKSGLVGAAMMSPLAATGAEPTASSFTQERPAATANPFTQEKETAPDWAKLLQPFAGKDIEEVMDRYTVENPNLSPEAWKVGAKFYKGTDAGGMVPNPAEPGSWMAPGGGSVHIKSKTRVSNDELEQDDTEITPISASGKRGETTYNYGGRLGRQKVSGTKFRQIIPSQEKYFGGPSKVRSVRF